MKSLQQDFMQLFEALAHDAAPEGATVAANSFADHDQIDLVPWAWIFGTAVPSAALADIFSRIPPTSLTHLRLSWQQKRQVLWLFPNSQRLPQAITCLRPALDF